MKDLKIPSHQIDVVEIMKKIRQSAANNRSELTRDERIKREAKTDFLNMAQSAQIPDTMVEEIRQQNNFPPFDPRTLYASARPGLGSLIGLIRRLLKPITKLFINLDPMAHEVHRLTVLNNFYVRTIQDLIQKTSALQVDLHLMKKRYGHQRHRDDRPQQRNHRRHRYNNRRDSSDNRNSQPVRASSATEPSA